MCCPECEDYIDEDGCCSCTPDEDDSPASEDYPVLDATEIFTMPIYRDCDLEWDEALDIEM